ncbi:MAG: hypothetical protein KCHDKBKB_00843 [Elusimicrobia bacterium]|nr:hypothetical protein [Elusimicrobiota bacterium]
MIHRLVQFKHDSRLENIWLTVYADLVTNLMLVFLALYGLTVMGDDALSQALQSMKLDEIYSLQDDDLSYENVAPVLRQKFKSSADVKITEEVDAIRIEFGENVLFNSGSALPKKGSVEAIRMVAELMKNISHTIVIEGHTDSVPLARQGLYRDNEELSLARAMSIVRLLIDLGMPAEKLAAAAYGAHRPRVSNDSVSGRRINRRVEIALFKDFPYGR